MKNKKIRIMVLAALVVLAGIILYVNDVKAGQVSMSDMAGIMGKKCCSGTRLLYTCQSSGTPCNSCGNCGGYWILGGGTLDGCILGGSGTCEDVEVPCTCTVFCGIDYIQPDNWCLANQCYPNEGFSCNVCKETFKINNNWSQTCE